MTKLSIAGIGNNSEIVINNCENFIVSLSMTTNMASFDIVELLPSEIELKLYDDRDQTYSRDYFKPNAKTNEPIL